MSHRFLIVLTTLFFSFHATAQDINQLGGGFGLQDENSNRNFNPFDKDSTKKSKVIPKGIHVWTVDRKFGDIEKAEVDTLPHLFPQSTLGPGMTGHYNTIGNNYSARLGRIFADRPLGSQFMFLDHYDQVLRQPDEWHFTNSLSPITNLTYDNCGDNNNGEDHLQARFAVNAGKKTGLGFDINYAYARGYFQNQSTSHFGATFYGSHLGDRYQLHFLFSTNHQKAAENGGLTDDNYVTHPELTSETFTENEIPVILSSNWNRNVHQRLFLSHRYNVGFYRKVKMTEEEIKAKQFAEKSAKANAHEKEDDNNKTTGRPQQSQPILTGRPDNAKIAGKEPTIGKDSLATDSTRIKVHSKAMADSLLTEQAKADSLEALMKREFVPVSSFIHTLELGNYERIHQAYRSPSGYYANTFYNTNQEGYPNDSIYDEYQHFDIKNTLAIALMEGFNKYAKAGIKGFATHELRRFDMPVIDGDGCGALGRWTEHNVSIGGQLLKTQGHTLHYKLLAEAWLAGEDAGQLKINGSGDLNFPIFGDTVRLQAKAHFYRLAPTFFQRNYHSKHLWWENSFDKETRTRVEGTFTYEKTKTRFRVAIEEIQNYTYLGMAYTRSGETVTGLTAQFRQEAANINIMTAQLDQRLNAGPLHWDNIITYQTSSNKNVLPVPTLNVFTNLYFKFLIAKVLKVELGGSATWFTKYYAPDYCPQLNSFAVQESPDSRVELGNFPFIDVYANMHLKHARFFVMMSNVAGSSLNRMTFLTPHYPINNSVLHIGVSWNFFN